MSDKISKDINKVLDTVRRLVSVIKDESIAEREADKQVGRLLVALDQLMSKIDGDSDTVPTKMAKAEHLKIEIESPKKAKKPTKKGS